MDLTAFFEDFQNTVRTIATSDGMFVRTSFIEEMARRLSEAEEVDSLLPCEYEGVGHRKKRLLIDGYDFDDEDGQLVLAAADYSESDRIERLTTTEAQKRFAAVEGFVREGLDGDLLLQLEESSDEYQVVSQMRETRASISVIRIYLITNRQLSDSIQTFEPKTVDGFVIEYHLWDIERLFRIEMSKLGREEIDIDLTEWIPAGLPALAASTVRTDLVTYLTVIPGAMLADIYSRYGSRVLESNVRSFLTARGKVNKGIRGTVMQEPEMFLPYNNGITATATSVESSASGDSIRIARIKNLQIVNGGQTTASLFYVRKNDKASMTGIDVQAKLIVVAEEESAELVPKISRFANTQNRVSEADFFSNHPFHQRMEEKSRQILTPVKRGEHYQTKWFYERTRGQYLNEKARGTAAQARKFEAEYPKSQVITKTDAAKYIVSWMQRPNVVSSGAQKNFVAFAETIAKEWSANDNQFGDDYFKELAAKCLLFHGVRRQVLAADWYSSGYLANIVTYALAKLSFELTRYRGGSELNFQIIWNRQGLPDVLLEILEEIAEVAFGVLTDEGRPVVNVTEWAKRERCWDLFKSAEYELPGEIDEFLLTKEEVIDSKARAAKNQKMDSGITGQMAVLELGPAYWNNAREFALKIGTLSGKEDSILQIVMSESSGRIPTEAQSRVLLAFRDRISKVGFIGR